MNAISGIYVAEEQTTNKGVRVNYQFNRIFPLAPLFVKFSQLPIHRYFPIDQDQPLGSRGLVVTSNLTQRRSGAQQRHGRGGVLPKGVPAR
jgi:hypothetical protein